MKDICKRLNVDTKIYKEKSLLAAISHAKDELISPEEYATRAAASGDYAKKKQAEIYREYQEALRKNNALDFDDLIVKTVELFRVDAQVLDYYQEPLPLHHGGWSTMIRIRLSSNCEHAGHASTRTFAWSVMMTSRFISSAARISTTF